MSKHGVTVKDVPARQFIDAYAAQLKQSGKIELPKWVDLVKTATFKELPPIDPDWFYTRAASMARRIYLRGSIGVGTFKKIYGGTKSTGPRPGHFAESSGSVVRAAIKSLIKIGIISQDAKNPQGPKKLTREGQRDLDRVASSLLTKKQQK